MEDKAKYDKVSPNHYREFSKETFQMMIDIWGKDAFIKFCEMNAFKYRMRLGLKPDEPIEADLSKARRYIEIRDEVLKNGKI